ncbi:MAG: hypothetical protein Q7R32_04315 [Dehalococcoidia bacterium]|nr:hypothetical protein [Dehalococcoidia bacterium]
MAERAQLIEEAAAHLGGDTKAILQRLAECDGGDWYLREKIVRAPNGDALLDNSRPLKYAYNFLLKGASVTFVREGRDPSPDLMVTVGGFTFYVEVRKFRMGAGRGASDPVSKIVDAVDEKRSQLPDGSIGFVAIDNFDIRLEPRFTHERMKDALIEIERRATENPDGWRKPSGVIVATATSIGGGPGIERPPHLLWTTLSLNTLHHWY